MKYIFEVLVADHYSAEQYAAAWKEASKLIQQAPGARGTYLHRDLNNPHRLLAIAHWDNKAARDASADRQDPAVRQIVQSQAEYVSIKLIGEFAEPDWQVVPGRS
jgi:heme-degrading monooxygenase HmoA